MRTMLHCSATTAVTQLSTLALEQLLLKQRLQQVQTLAASFT
jgi:hypothetical protein